VDNRIDGKNILVSGLDAVAATGENADAAEVVFTVRGLTEDTAAGAAEIKSAAGDGK